MRTKKTPAVPSNDITPRNISDFMEKEYADSALYQSFRAIGNYIDGLKPSSRKVLHAARKLRLTSPTIVGRFAMRAADETKYIHGAASLEWVIVGMAQDYVGANNIPIFSNDGTFGSRFTPSAAASRYISTQLRPEAALLFKEEDDPILLEQEFEGDKIEPRYFIPALPMLLVNGSEGIGNGFSQKILPRSPAELKKAIAAALAGKTLRCPPPWYRGFGGAITAGEEPGSWLIWGRFERTARGSLQVTELPIGYTLAGYRERLEDLVEKKVIKSYEDRSDDDVFLFDIRASLEFMDLADEKIVEKLGLIRRVTENYTCEDENNIIRVFDSADAILEAYVQVRRAAYAGRKRSLVERYDRERAVAEEKARFIRQVISGSIRLGNVPTARVIERLEADERPFIRVDDSYDYLLNLPMRSLTRERAEELDERAEAARLRLSELKKKTEVTLWAEDLEAIA